MVEKNVFKRGLVIGIILLFIGVSVTSSSAIMSLEKNFLEDNKTLSIDEGTEYWALLVAVGVYANDPDAHRPSMLNAIDDLYNILISSTWWSSNHIKVIKGEDATVPNIISGFKWLDKMEDENDISLVFMTTHGMYLGYDKPPKDETDNTDEALTTYWSSTFKTRFISDDKLNSLLNRLESKGVCFIVDTCFGVNHGR